MLLKGWMQEEPGITRPGKKPRRRVPRRQATRERIAVDRLQGKEIEAKGAGFLSTMGPDQGTRRGGQKGVSCMCAFVCTSVQHNNHAVSLGGKVLWWVEMEGGRGSGSSWISYGSLICARCAV
ncbi:hypothetical protein L228DRAFT_17726 [Xylona heveae TC161]|uniref:Uncharacterized protein n=1 Tax=Xylona heveae (strain CBS 132557 / TC161) TaxID=1328760 RepID=A0A165JX44_XYLHT|nr:hypothetical protein L228DRAFT_17726 [Xylona heveae TC161]KZF26733.1 hypothetical protein L228DRAFT_17726 [Xylona heveae TC161]